MDGKNILANPIWWFGGIVQEPDGFYVYARMYNDCDFGILGAISNSFVY